MQRVAEYRNGLSRCASEVIIDVIRDKEMCPKDTGHYVKTQLGPGFPFISIKTDYDPVTKTAVSICIDGST